MSELLKIEILRDFIYQNPRNHGSVIHIGSCRICIFNRRSVPGSFVAAVDVDRSLDKPTRLSSSQAVNATAGDVKEGNLALLTFLSCCCAI